MIRLHNTYTTVRPYAARKFVP